VCFCVCVSVCVCSCMRVRVSVSVCVRVLVSLLASLTQLCTWVYVTTEGIMALPQASCRISGLPCAFIKAMAELVVPRSIPTAIREEAATTSTARLMVKGDLLTDLSRLHCFAVRLSDVCIVVFL